MPTPLLEQLAGIAHDLWCTRMRADGWTYGPIFDAALRTHDAMGPFGTLSTADRQHARDATVASGAVELLSACIRYPRGHGIPVPLRSLEPSARVRLVGTDRIEEIKVDPRDVGVVEEVVREGGRTVRVLVRWPSGDQTIHVEGDGDLALAVDT